MSSKYFLVLFFALSFSCTHTIKVKNEKKRQLTATHRLIAGDLKRIELDYETAPQSPYIQMVDDTSGVQLMTFYNQHNRSIIYYDYTTGTKLGATKYEREGPNGIIQIEGYYYLNKDSIFVYTQMRWEFFLTDSDGIIKKRWSFGEERKENGPNIRRQFVFSTVMPIIKIQDNLILTGFALDAIPAEAIDDCPFSASLNLKTDEIKFLYNYPKEYYGFNANWEGGAATFVYPELSPNGEIIHSFPMSHNLYIAPWDSNDFRTVYAGSNYASTIHSINSEPKNTPREVLFYHLAHEDQYMAIRYDKYRKLYYRIILHGIPGANNSTRTVEKPISVIVMDEHFNYMGETVIGTGEQWNWENMFVTREGLNIEYISNDEEDEDYMIFQIFNVEKIE